MFKRFLILEWRAFTRSASFSTNLWFKILMGLIALYFAVVFLILGVGAFYLIEEELNSDPLVVVSKFLFYYFVCDLIFRLMLQKIPVMNIKPLLYLPINKSTIVNFALGKTVVSFFNIVHWFFFVPFTVVLLIEGYDIMGVILWYVGVMSLIYINNFANILINNKDYLFNGFIIVAVIFGALQYYEYFDITAYTFHFFYGLFDTSYMAIIPLVTLIGLFVTNFRFLRDNLHLDTRLSQKTEEAKTEGYDWLNKYGVVGTFLKNDIRLIKRNKRSKSTVWMSILFLFYGLIFFTLEAYDKPIFHIMAAIFVTGGFLFTFGQFVPSWDSSYYNLMMTQNVPYRDYLTAKWWMIVLATVVSTVVSSFYLYFGVDIYLILIVAGIYNIGVNSHLVLLGGAYTKTPIDLQSSKNAFGDKKAFNVKTMLISFPKLLLPMALYGLGTALVSSTVGLLLVALTGIIGFALKDKVFTLIERVYKKEKYSTVQAYKENNN
ncbi:MAG: hypothetical protein IR153_03430 [Flavobacterium sp.]|nr:hypothetical protein [Flavobacterium sp.]